MELAITIGYTIYTALIVTGLFLVGANHKASYDRSYKSLTSLVLTTAWGYFLWWLITLVIGWNGWTLFLLVYGTAVNAFCFWLWFRQGRRGISTQDFPFVLLIASSVMAVITTVKMWLAV